jgi:hypothetical protein
VKRRLTIQSKLLGIFVMAAVLPIAVVSLLAYNNSLKAVEKMVGNRTNRVAASVGTDLDKKFRRRLGDTVLWVSQPVQTYLKLLDSPDAAAKAKAATDVRDYYRYYVLQEYGRYYREIILADATGEPLFPFGTSRAVEGLFPAVTATREALADSLAAAMPYEFPLPKDPARVLEAYKRTLEAARLGAQGNDGVVGKGVAPKPPQPPTPESVLGEDVIATVTKALRLPVPGEVDNMQFAGPGLDALDDRRLRLSEDLRADRFRPEDRIAAQNGARLKAGQSMVVLRRSSSGRAEAVRIVRPVFAVDDSTKRLGVIILDLRPDYIFPEDLAGERFGSKGQLAVVDAESGEILFHSRQELQGEKLFQVNPVLAAVVIPEKPRPPGSASTGRRDAPSPRSWS